MLGRMSHSVLSVGCRVVVDACERLGLRSEELLGPHGLTRAQLDDPDGRLAPEQVRAVWDAAYEKSGDPQLALRVAEAIPGGAYRVLEYLIASAPSVGAAFSKIGDYFAWIDTSVRVPVGPCAQLYAFGLELDAPPAQVPLRALEFTFATSLLKVRALSRQALSPVRVDAAGPAPADASYLERFFDCPWRFETGHNRMLFDARSWQLPCLDADPSLLGVLEQHAQGLVSALEREPELVTQLRQLLTRSGPALSLGAAARQLGLSARTLQRRLAESGHVFADLADAVRQQLARRMLADRRIAIAEAAYLLGFADQSSFTRSFKRWTGVTPAAFRRTQLGSTLGSDTPSTSQRPRR
jgi:AraC-like DNA-binding protein